MSVFADSVYAQPGLTHMVRQYDRNPARGESILSVVATPSAAAVASENSSNARTYDKINWRNAQGQVVKTLTPSTARAALTSHTDAYRNFFDSTSIKRNYTG